MVEIHVEDIQKQEHDIYKIVKILELGTEKSGGYKIAGKIYNIGDKISEKEIDEIMGKRIPGLGIVREHY